MVLVIVTVTGCGKYSQKVYQTSPDILIGVSKVAIIPFENLSMTPNANKVVSEMFHSYLESAQKFQVSSRDEVKNALKSEVTLARGKIDRAVARSLGKELDVDAVIVGSVLEYTYLQEVKDGTVVAREPIVGILVRMIDVQKGSILWSSLHSRSSYEILRSNHSSITDVAQKAIDYIVHTIPGQHHGEKTVTR